MGRFEKLEQALTNCASFELNCMYSEPDTCTVTSEFNKKVRRIRNVTVENNALYPVANFKTLIIRGIDIDEIYFRPKNLNELMPNLETILIEESQHESESFATLFNSNRLELTRGENRRLVVSKLTYQKFQDDLNPTHSEFLRLFFKFVNVEKVRELENFRMNFEDCSEKTGTEEHIFLLKALDEQGFSIEAFCKALTETYSSRIIYGGPHVQKYLKIYTPWY